MRRIGYLISVSLLGGCAFLAPLAAGVKHATSPEAGDVKPLQVYALPKTVLRAVIFQGEDETRQFLLQAKKIQDPAITARVDFDRSLIHVNDVAVSVAENGFLQSVSASTNSNVPPAAQLPDTARKLARIGADLKAAAQKIAELDFDPFSFRELSATNAVLLSSGYCIRVDDLDKNPLPGSCAAGLRRNKAALRPPPSRESRKAARYSGFYFRKPRPHDIELMQRNPGGGWTSVWRGAAEFENSQPLLKLEVNRRIFIAQQAAMRFDNGALAQFELARAKHLNGMPAIKIRPAPAPLSIDSARPGKNQIPFLQQAGASPDGARLWFKPRLTEGKSRAAELPPGPLASAL